MALRGAGVAALTAACLGAAEVHARVGGDPSVADDYVRRWARGTLRLCNVRVRQDGQPPPPPPHARLVVANHRSALDIPILLSRFGGAVLSKAELADWPLLGTGAKKAGCIFVDREDPRSGAKAMRAIRTRLQAGTTVSVFPEGTTFAGDEVRPLNRGALVAARGLEVEFLCVGIAHPAGTEFIEEGFDEHVANFASRRRLDVGLAFGRPHRITGRPAELVPKLQDELQALVDRARAIVGG